MTALVDTNVLGRLANDDDAGKQVHDARIVAVCHVHQVTHLLTFDVGHFARFAAAPPGVVVLHPASV